jgi:hypothetical protein
VKTLKEIHSNSDHNSDKNDQKVKHCVFTLHVKTKLKHVSSITKNAKRNVGYVNIYLQLCIDIFKEYLNIIYSFIYVSLLVLYLIRLTFQFFAVMDGPHKLTWL